MTSGTWGISGPAFLLAYGVLAVVVGIAALRRRRALAQPRRDRAPADLTDRPEDIAYLNGGPDLAVFAALGAMHVRGTIAPARGSVQAVGRLHTGASELERAIHFTAAAPVARRRLAWHGPVASALSTVRTRLERDELLLTADARRQIRGTGLWMLAVAGLGFLRLLAGVAEARPVGYLALELTAVLAAAGVLLVAAPRRTRLGDRVLADLRREHDALAPRSSPDWALYGAVGAGLGIAVFGTSALWASDPAFASELALQRTSPGGDGSAAAYGGDSSGGGDGGGGGGGGCGGGCGG